MAIEGVVVMCVRMCAHVRTLVCLCVPSECTSICMCVVWRKCVLTGSLWTTK